MLETAMSSGKLFFAGKLFRDNTLVLRQLVVGAGAGAVVMIVVGLVAPLWLAAIAGGLLSGALQPMLYKNLKYA